MQPKFNLRFRQALRPISYVGPLACAAVLAVPAVILPSSAFSQGTTATLSGTVTDPTGAIVPGAQATLTGTQSGAKRTTKANSAGIFVFAAVPTGDYDVRVEMPGFESTLLHNIHLDPSDNKNLTKVVLTIGEVTQTINVSAADAGLTSSGEKSVLITASDISKLSVEGRDVGELVRILPGFAIAQTSGSIDNTSYDASQVNVTGALRSFASNGNSANGVTLLSDGANISDPGNYGDSVQNVNTDMVEEVKVQTSNFTAENSNGPIVVNAVGKSGTQAFHGELYTYGRASQFNSQDSLSKTLNQAKPNDRFIYPGGNLSGPLLIPGTNFNHARKLTFFVGGEEYAQRNIYAYGSASQAIAKSLVPTARMRAGDFSCPALLEYLGSAITCNTNGMSTIVNQNYNNIGVVPTTGPSGLPIVNGQLGGQYSFLGPTGQPLPPVPFADPGAKALLSVLPLPNRANLGDGYNFVVTNLVNNNLYQARTRVDYSASDRVKIFGTYNVERGQSGIPEVPYYSPAQGAPMGGVDTPGGGLISTINSQTAGLNLTLVLSQHLTNEVTANLTILDQEFLAKNQAALNSSTIGYPYPGLFGNNSLQYPQLHDYGYDGLPLGMFPDFSVATPYAKKFLPSAADNLTYVIKTHTIKAGVYVQQVTNNQRLLPSTSSTNGQIADYYFGPTFTDSDIYPGHTTGTTISTTGNYTANFYEGLIEQYNQQNFVPIQNLYFWNVDAYATDDWKVLPKLSLQFGLRLEHLGPWIDKHGIGIAVFDPSTLASSTSAVPGFTWHGINSSIPTSGVPSRLAFVEPRVGLSYDFYGNGKTVARGGWGMYRNHDNYNVVQQAAALAEGVQVAAVSGGAGVRLSSLQYIVPSNGGQVGAGNYQNGLSVNAYGLQKGDDQQPLTYTYSFTVDQQMPKNSVFEISYNGNHGADLTAQNVNVLNTTLQNVNPVPLGALFHPNPVTGAVVPLGLIDGLGTAQINQYRPYPQYGNIDVPRHILYSFYNGLQTSWNKQSGRLTYGLNYTWSKALGIRDGYYNGNASDATNLRNNYGPLSFDHTHIFNASYAMNFGDPFKGRRLLGLVADGWLISGITGLQSGANLQATYSPNLNLQGKLGLPGSPTQLNVDNKVFLGTPDVLLQPVLTCNPAAHTGKNQFINGSCFQLPQIGQNGAFNFPYLHSPAYFNTDLTVAKTFAMKDARNLQIRLAGFNFLNHPLNTFSTSFPQQVQLNLSNLRAGGELASPALATQSAGFGSSTFKVGRRVAEIAIKYNF